MLLEVADQRRQKSSPDVAVSRVANVGGQMRIFRYGCPCIRCYRVTSSRGRPPSRNTGWTCRFPPSSSFPRSGRTRKNRIGIWMPRLPYIRPGNSTSPWKDKQSPSASARDLQRCWWILPSARARPDRACRLPAVSSVRVTTGVPWPRGPRLQGPARC